MFRLASAGARCCLVKRAAGFGYPSGRSRVVATPRLRRGSSAAAMSTSAGRCDASAAQRLASLLVRGPPPDAPGDEPDGTDALSRLASSLSSESPPPPMSAVLALSGGAVRSSSALATTPGSSSILRECVFPYDRTSYAEFVSSHPLPPKEVLEDPGVRRSASGGAGKGFSFASPASAVLLSNAALHRSMELSATLGDMRSCVGVGCSAMLVSGDPAKKSNVHIAVSSVDGTTEIIDAVLSAEGYSNGGDDNDSAMRRRDRVEEDEAASALLLLTMIKNRYGTGGGAGSEATAEAVNLAADSILNRDGDSRADEVMLTPSPGGGGSPDVARDALDPIRFSARRVISGSSPSSSSAALLLPAPSFSARGSTFRPVAATHAVLPPDPLIFPGSFNPPHVGHVALANAAVRAMERKRKAEWEERERRAGFHLAQTSFLSTADSAAEGADLDSEGGGPVSENEGPAEPGSPTLVDGVWSAVEYHNHKSSPSVLFEMSLTNPDKPPMDEDEVARRVGLFGQCLDTADDDGEGTEMPRDWGVLLTSAPLFVEKVAALGGMLAPTRNSYSHSKPGGKSWRRMTFVIGMDTMVRIINPKYYSNSYDSMLDAVREMGDAGVHFVVGGRLEQGKGEGEETRFVTGEKELLSLPDDVQNMFTIIQEEDFRIDLSSTELRKRARA